MSGVGKEILGETVQEAIGGRREALVMIHDTFANVNLYAPPNQYDTGAPMFNLENAARDIEREIRELAKVVGGKASWEMKEYPMVNRMRGGLVMVHHVKLDYKPMSEDEMEAAVEAVTDWCRKNKYDPKSVSAS